LHAERSIIAHVLRRAVHGKHGSSSSYGFDAPPKSILRNAAFASSTDQLGMAYDRYSKDLEQIRRRGVQIVKTPDSVLEAELRAWDRVIAAQSQDPFFRQVIDSQKAWVKRTGAYLQVNNLGSAPLEAAYKHFFG
jgi:TRAP-type mannitol/chloroaromatic compound transport system substrate-binding protein